MQLALGFRQRGGKRKGAGRKPVGDRAGVSHRVRPTLSGREPIHVTLRVREDAPNLRVRRVSRAVRAALIFAADRLGMRVVHFAVLRNHIHLIAEADDQEALARGMKGLKVRIARAVNNVCRRVGSLFSDRYHAQVLRSPTQTRYAIAYALNNYRRHQAQAPRRLPADYVDPCSSAQWFDGWCELDARPTLLAEAKSWLLNVGWRKRGLLSIATVPG